MLLNQQAKIIMKKEISENVKLLEGIKVSLTGKTITITGAKGNITRTFHHPNVKITQETNMIKFSATKATKREKSKIYSFAAHTKNMMMGAMNGCVYKLKICASHFPMSVTMNGKEIQVKNFLGEKVPRIIKIKENVTVKIQGEIITVESADRELAGNTASKIEHLTFIAKKDRRVYQDGIYITEKNNKPLVEQ